MIGSMDIKESQGDLYGQSRQTIEEEEKKDNDSKVFSDEDEINIHNI